MDLRDFQNRQFGPEDFFAMLRSYLPQIGVVLVVILVLTAGTSMLYRIDASDEGVVLRFGRHLKTVERIIGFKKGTGGSSGVKFLRQAIDIRLFPELIDVRTVIGENHDA